MNNLQTDGKFYKHFFPLEIIWSVLCVQYRSLFNCLGSMCFREVILNSLFELYVYTEMQTRALMDEH